LTAAHCYPPQEDYVTYSVTINFTNAEQLTGYEHLRQIHESLLFPEYNVSIPYLNDIMLLKLSSPVWEVEPLDINSDPNVPTDGQLMSVMGFGATYDSNVSDPYAILRFPEVLQEAELQVVGDEECFLQYGLESAINVPFILCAFAPEEAACRGDSGGPLIIERPSQSDLEVGIVSFGLDCASTGSTLFTQVSFYYE
jgi:secreted trypsin-like serine protease